ncbi:MAG: alpha-amylase family glycosyl hydrolase [Bacilli bacterium]|nr:alpha-amylase family glycosyl hydrolase [Bacilli bacterium]
MKKKKLLFIPILAMLLTSCGGGNTPTTGETSAKPTTSGSVPEIDPEDYDAWTDTWSKPNHLYFHYNRGEGATDYDNYCLWLWQFFPQNLEGTLWGYDGPTKVSDKLTLKPMSTSFMTFPEVGLEGSGTFCDKYGIIFDVDLSRTDLIGGKTGTPVTFNGAEEVGFLLPLQSSMDGSKNWTSDGGCETYVEGFNKEENWRTVEGGKAMHLYTCTGNLSGYTFRVGSGVIPPQPIINPVDSDTTGKYRSETEEIPEYYETTDKTSDTFKELGVGYQIFVASFRDSNGDGIGDIRGIIDSLDYLEDLGVECLWLTPVNKSDSYHGYDVSNYTEIDRRYGTKEDYIELLNKAHAKGMKVLMDLVLNHTSKTNEWFKKSKMAEESDGIKWRNVYTWKYKEDMVKKAKMHYDDANKKWVLDGYSKITVEEDANSNNPSWYRDGESNYYYYGKFGSGMPEINYENIATRNLIIEKAKYWLNIDNSGVGIDGYRLDAVKHIYMNDEVEDTEGDVIINDVGEAKSYDDEKGEYIYKKYDYSSDLTKNVNWWNQFSKALKDINPNFFLVGENFDGWGTRTSNYYRALDSQFDFSNYYHIPAWIYNTDQGAASYNDGTQAAETFVPFASNENFEVGANYLVPGGNRKDFINGAFTSNHDVMRVINQANGTGDKNSTAAKEHIEYGDTYANGKAMFQAAVTILNRGLSWIYYGDELGMSSNTNTHIAKYGSENSMDIWYRQPFLWNDKRVRSNYKFGQFTFELDDHNKHLVNNGEGVKYTPSTDTTPMELVVDNEFYEFYKGLIAIKKEYPKDAHIEYKWSSKNVLRIFVTDPKDPSYEMQIFLQNGLTQDEYKYALDASYENIKSLNDAPTTTYGNIGGKNFAVAAFKKK